MKKKYKYLMAIICIFSAMLWIWVKNVDHKAASFPIRHVIVDGEYWHVPQNELKTILSPYVHQGYFFINLFSLKHTLLNKEPWLDTVSISRDWPTTLLITLQQKKAVANWNNMGLVTPEGEVFSPPLETFPPDLPEFVGAKEAVKEMLKQYQVFTSAANPVKLSIIKVELSAKGNWSVKLSNKIVVMLGEDDILARFKRFIKVYQQVLLPEHREPSSVDMRYSHGMAVNWKS